jgi:hypothetical protein
VSERERVSERVSVCEGERESERERERERESERERERERERDPDACVWSFHTSALPLLVIESILGLFWVYFGSILGLF